MIYISDLLKFVIFLMFQFLVSVVFVLFMIGYPGSGLLRWYSDSLWAVRFGDRIPVWARFSEPVQTVSEVHQNYYTKGTGSFPGVKRPGCGFNHSAPSSAEVEERVCLFSAVKVSYVFKITFYFLSRISGHKHYIKNFLHESRLDYVCKVGKYATVNLLITINQEVSGKLAMPSSFIQNILFLQSFRSSESRL